MTPQEKQAAILFAKAYSGDFDFMIAMRSQAQNPSWNPTDNQITAILRCKHHDEKAKAAGQTSKPKLCGIKGALWNNGPSGWITVSMLWVANIQRNILEPILVSRHMYGEIPQRKPCSAKTGNGSDCKNQSLLGAKRCGVHATYKEKWHSTRAEKRQAVWKAVDGSTHHTITV